MKKIAEAIILAAKIREKSFDHERADELQKSDSFIKDFTKFYTKTLEESAKEAVDTIGIAKIATQPIYLLLACAWNDALAWAEQASTNEGGDICEKF